MGIISLISMIFGTAGSAIGSLFNFKSEQAQVVQQTIRTLGDIQASYAQRDIAIQQALSVQPGSGFANNVRPLIALAFALLVVSSWFGLEPPHISAADHEWIYTIVGTYMGITAGGRTLEKIVQMITSSNVLKTLIDKKVL